MPTYFPMMWLPYIPAELFSFDYRWIALGVFTIAMLLYAFRLGKQDLIITEKLFKIAIPYVTFLLIGQHAANTFGHAVELTPVGFYMIMIYFLFHKKYPWLMAFGFVLCLMSRYAITLWLPFFFIVYWVEKGFPNAFRLGIYTVIGILLIYVIPFLSKDWQILSNGLAYYKTTAETQWLPPGGGQVYHIHNGLSFSSIFYDLTNGSILERLSLARNCHLIFSVLAFLLIIVTYFSLKRSHKSFNPRLFSLVALKFYFSFFYSFIYVPFGYLFFVPLSISFLLLFELRIGNPRSLIRISI